MTPICVAFLQAFAIIFLLGTASAVAGEDSINPDEIRTPSAVILTDPAQGDTAIEDMIKQIYIDTSKSNIEELVDILEISGFSCKEKSEDDSYYCDYQTPIFLDIEIYDEVFIISFRRQISLSKNGTDLSVSVNSGTIAP